MERLGLEQIDEALRACIAACEEVVVICEHTGSASIGQDGLNAVVRACRDCADIATLCAQFLARHAELSPEICELCSKACENCADECDKHGGELLATCSEVCRRCITLCEQVFS